MTTRRGIRKTNLRSSTGQLVAQHGLSRTVEYRTWNQMWDRCTNKDSRSYPRYGRRGIKVCHRWVRFENFLADMGPRPPGRSLERKNNDLGYDPTNCIWATKEAQDNNRSTNRVLVYRGESRTLVQWARAKGLGPKTIKYRLDKLKWSVEQALDTPLMRVRRKRAA